MKNELSPEQTAELESKLENFNEYVESSIESDMTSHKDSFNQGECSYLVERHNINDNVELSEVLLEAQQKSSISVKQLVEFAIENNYFKMKYEELANPHHYGSAIEDEFYSIRAGGDRECQIDRDSIKSDLPSFDLNQEFESYQEFEKFVKYNVGSNDYLKKYWEFATNPKMTHTQVIYNSDYDCVRCVLNNEDSLIEYLNDNPKVEEPFTKKVLKITKDQYHELRENYDGFCVKCGKINDGGHEPDAENYDCGYCETKNSFGIETLMISEGIEIVDDELDSNIDDCY